jgi:hypothetical protein
MDKHARMNYLNSLKELEQEFLDDILREKLISFGNHFLKVHLEVFKDQP